MGTERKPLRLVFGFKLMELFKVYKEFHGIKTKSNDGEVDIDDILQGL